MIAVFAICFYLAALLAIFYRPFSLFLGGQFSINEVSGVKRLEALDALRFFAALWVACYHFWQWPSLNISDSYGILNRGNVGVSFFCVLSGFSIHQSTIAKGKTIKYVLLYYCKRFLRIYPLYFFSALFVVYFAHISLNSLVGWTQLLNEVSMARAFTFFRVDFFNPPAWSLYVEVVFYLLFPIWFLLLQNKKWEIVGGLLMWIAILLLVSDSNRDFSIFSYFCSGILASLFYSKLKNWPKIYLVFSVMSLLMGVWLFVQTNHEGFAPIDFKIKALLASNTTWIKSDFSTFYGWLQMNLALLLLLLACIELPILRKILSVKIFRRLGAISYGVYLFHSFLIASFCGMHFEGGGSPRGTCSSAAEVGIWYFLFAYIPALISMGSLLFIVVERPFLMLKRKC